jgi:hypothetical protein
MTSGPHTREVLPAPAPGFVRPALAQRPTLLIAALLAVLLAFKLGHTLNNDVAWYIHSAEAFLAGGRLYDDVFFEVNPPLMLYLTVPGVILARLTGWFPGHAYVVTIFAALTGALWLSARILPAMPGRERHLLLITAALALALLPAGDFGQRSHLMLCLVLPYLLLVASRLSAAGPGCSLWTAVVAGALAGLGSAIKPHDLLLPAAVELLLLWRTRRIGCLLRPESLALAVAVALYALALLVFTPEYVTRVVPYALEVYNGAYRNSLGVVLTRPETLLAPVAILVHLRARRRPAPHQAAMGDVFSLAAATLFAIYVIQMKGWNYHLYPTTAMLVMLAGTMLGSTSSIAREQRFLALGAALALLVKAAICADNRYPLMDRLLPVVREHAKGGAIYVFSSNTWTGFPLALYADVRWASRFPALWLLPGVEQRRHEAVSEAERALLAEIEHFTTEAVIADLSAGRPEVVVVDARPHKPWYGDVDFDFIDHFSGDPRFAALWTAYEQIGEVEGFEVYRRRGGPSRQTSP